MAFEYLQDGFDSFYLPCGEAGTVSTKIISFLEVVSFIEKRLLSVESMIRSAVARRAVPEEEM